MKCSVRAEVLSAVLEIQTDWDVMLCCWTSGCWSLKGSKIPWNVGNCSPNDEASHPKGSKLNTMDSYEMHCVCVCVMRAHTHGSFKFHVLLLSSFIGWKTDGSLTQPLCIIPYGRDKKNEFLQVGLWMCACKMCMYAPFLWERQLLLRWKSQMYKTPVPFHRPFTV
jgi:hypothetical protein